MIIKAKYQLETGGVNRFITRVFDGVEEYLVEDGYWVLNSESRIVGSAYSESSGNNQNPFVELTPTIHLMDVNSIVRDMNSNDEKVKVWYVDMKLWDGSKIDFVTSASSRIYVMNNNGKTIDQIL